MRDLYSYNESKQISGNGYGFYSLLFALIRKADSSNLEKIERIFPDEVAEFQARYNAPGGILEDDPESAMSSHRRLGL